MPENRLEKFNLKDKLQIYLPDKNTAILVSVLIQLNIQTAILMHSVGRVHTYDSADKLRSNLR